MWMVPKITNNEVEDDDEAPLLATCIDNMCDVDDTKDYHVEYYEDI